MQMLAVAAILVLGGLQFLPATHFRLHQDRGRNWIPIDPSLHAAVLVPAAAVSSCLSRLSVLLASFALALAATLLLPAN
jgi:hypothetical protein